MSRIDVHLMFKSDIEQTTEFHACVVKKSISILIDKNNRNSLVKRKLNAIGQVKLSQH